MDQRDYVTVRKASERLGLSQSAIRGYIKRDDWAEGKHYHRSPNNRIVIDMEAVYNWFDGGKRA